MPVVPRRCRLGLAALLLALPALAACTGPRDTVIYNRHVDATYRPQEFWMQAGGRDFQTQVYGNPFPVEHETLATAVTSAMQGAHFGPQTNFTEAPGENNAHPYRVRMLFNALPTSGMGLCSETPVDVPATPVRSGGGQGYEVKLLAAYCGGDSRITSLTAGVEGVQGPDDPAFTDFIRRVTLALFPPNNPELNDQRCVIPGC